MTSLNFKFLVQKHSNDLVKDREVVFKELIQKIALYYNIDVLKSYESIKFIPKKTPEHKIQNDFTLLGVEKNFNNRNHTISIYSDFTDFISFILLKEAYYCFIPHQLISNEIVQSFIKVKIEIDLETHPKLSEWKKLVHLPLEISKIDRLLKSETKEEKETPFEFFLKYIRKNVHLMQKMKMDDFYEKFYYEYSFKTVNVHLDEEVVESLRVLARIFFEVEKYNALVDYKSYLKSFIKNGKLQTNLSLRQFSKSIQILKKTQIAPAYVINYNSLNLSNICIFLEFNPKLKTFNLIEIINNIPFLVSPRFLKNSFSYEIQGFFIIPNKYFIDLEKFLNKLKDSGFIIKYKLINLTGNRAIANLNYHRLNFRDYYLINTNIPIYNDNYEIEASIAYTLTDYKKSLNLFDWLLIERILNISITGFGFERREDTLKILKNDILNEINNQREQIAELKGNIGIINDSVTKLKGDFLGFLSNNKSYGFFFLINSLSKVLKLLELIIDILRVNYQIKNEFQLFQYIENEGISNSIEDHILFKEVNITRLLGNITLSKYGDIKEFYSFLFRKFTIFFNILKSCSNLKIFNLKAVQKLINDENLTIEIYSSKERKLKEFYEKNKEYKITSKMVEEKITEFTKSGVIKPFLIHTLPNQKFTYFLIIIVRNTIRIRKVIEQIEFFFPYLGTTQIKELNKTSEDVCFFLKMPNLNVDEKFELISILKNKFGNDVICIKRYFWSGLIENYSIKDFYDFENEDFFYTKNLFDETYNFTRKILDERLEKYNNLPLINLNHFWSDEKSLVNLYNKVNNRISKQNIDFSKKELNLLYKFHLNLLPYILDLFKYKELRAEYFFKSYINEIYFIPALQIFGLNQHLLYFTPLNTNEIDYRLLFGNSFQDIKYPAQIDALNPILIQYIYPYRDAGYIPYLNWLNKSKKCIREYCSFFIKKTHQNLHFDYNLTLNGWDFDPNRFKNYVQNILFKRDYDIQIPGIKEMNIAKFSLSEYKGLETKEFKELTQIYSTRPIDIKSVWGTIPLKRAEYIKDLLQKELIFPYLSLKNLDLIEEISIILPNVKPEFNYKLINIFSFFNVAFIHEIEGEFYIYGFEDAIRFENGFMIVLHLPDCQLDELEKLFDMVFEYMEIDHYVILNDLVDGKPLLNSIYGNLKFLEEYNPLTNLIWSEKDKRWFNHKLFDQNFKPQYPDLFFGKPGLCKRCGVSLEKGKLCAECLCQLASLKDVPEEQLKKIIQSEDQELYIQILKEVRNLIEKSCESTEMIRKANNLIDVKLGE